MNPHTIIAQAIVDCHTSGLCPLDGPCETCDCFNPKHEQEKYEAKYAIEKLAERGYYIVPQVAGQPDKKP